MADDPTNDSPDQTAQDFKATATAKANELRDQATAKANDLRDQASAKIEDLRGQATAKAEELRGQAEAAWGDAKVKARTYQEDGEAYVRENPTKAVLIAVGAGFILGSLLKK